MSKHRKIAVLGGDERTLALTAHLAEVGCECAVWGMGKNALHFGAVRVRDISDALRSCVAVILPVPISRDSLTLNAPLHDGDAPRLSLIFDLIPADTPIIGGSFSPSLKLELEGRGHTYFDIVEREDFAEKNAIPTVEGALAIAISETKKTLARSRVAVVGMGRIGTRLADALEALGADVSVITRKKSFAAKNVISTHDIDKTEKDFDIIFNTAPARIFSREFLSGLREDCLIIDLASAPYGAAPADIEASGVRYIVASALPGKYSPVSAGEIIGECALDIMREAGVQA